MRIDLNCDCGESYGRWQLGDDAAVLEHVTSANIACGAHAGDPAVMLRTLQLARARDVAVGAHPGFPDLAGFGRRVLPMEPEELFASVVAQIGALAALARATGLELTHVKPHGALYNHAARTPAVAQLLARAVAAVSRDLIFVGLAGSAMLEAAADSGLQTAREAFADRAYTSDGALVGRDRPGALIEDPAAALAQALSIVISGTVTTPEGVLVPLHADTICVHGDTPGAAGRAAQLRAGLRAAGVDVVALRAPYGG